MSSTLFTLSNENEIPSFLSQNQLHLFSQILENTCEHQKQMILDRNQLIINNLSQTKDIFCRSFPKEILEMKVERFFEEFDGKIENVLTDIVSKMSNPGKSTFINKKNIVEKAVNYNKTSPKYIKQHKEVEICELERRIFEASIEATDKKNEDIEKLFKTPIVSKKKLENDSNLILDKSSKKHWVP